MYSLPRLTSHLFFAAFSHFTRVIIDPFTLMELSTISSIYPGMLVSSLASYACTLLSSAFALVLASLISATHN